MRSFVRRLLPLVVLGSVWLILLDVVGSPLRMSGMVDAVRRLATSVDAGAMSSDAVTEISIAALWVLVLAITVLFVVGNFLRIARFEPRGRWRRLGAMAVLVTGGVAATSAGVDAASQPMVVQPTGVVADDSTEGFREVAISVTSALVGAGVATVWLKRRKRAERSVGVDSDTDPAQSCESIEQTHLVDLQKTRRVQLAIRHLSSFIPSDRIDCAVLSTRADVTVEFLEPVKPIRYWNPRSSRSLELEGSTSLVDLERMTGGLDALEPLMVHVGHRADSQVWVPFEVGTPFLIDGPEEETGSVWKALVNAVMMSPFADLPLVTEHVTTSYPMGDFVRTEDRDSAFLAACAPTILDERSSDEGERSNLVVARGSIPDGGRGLRWLDGSWTLLPNSTPIVPVGWVDDEIQRIRQILGDDVKTTRSVVSVGPPDPISRIEGRTWTFMVSVLGHPEVLHHSGERVRFSKTKGEELVVWLALHPEQRRRGLARTALWNASVKDATFSNVAFDARRSLVLLEPGTRGDDWIPITMRDELPLSDRVTTDVRQLEEALDHARRHPEDDGLANLRAGLELVRGTPFADSDYIWPDQIGISGEAAVLVVRSALLMADMCKEIGDIDGVYWATSKGLLALPGHEELVAFRMRTHAEFGDFSAVRSEWDSYCRALAADDWGPVQPSPKLIELWKNLCLRST